MKEILKYWIGDLAFGVFKARIPEGAEILSVHAQGTVIAIFAIVDQREILEERFFVVLPTGASLTYSCEKHLATIQGQNGLFYRVYSCRKRPKA